MATKETTETVEVETQPVPPAPASGKKPSIAHRLYTGEISYDFVAHRKRWYAISAIAIAIALLALLFRGLNLGIEFTGGVDFRAPVTVTASTVQTLEDAVSSLGIAGVEEVNVTTIGANTVSVQTLQLTTDHVTTVREKIATTLGISSEDVTYSRIDASWGQQITSQALLALGVFLALVMVLIWVYFRNFQMSIAAIVALAHDVLLTIGVYSLVGFTVTPATVIGVLTILGYSLYDTVVVFDKIRENTRDLTNTDHTYSEQANLGVNQTLVRSLNTTVIGVLPVAALLFAGVFILGTGPLEDLGLALFVGMIVGAYSSIFIATPLLAQMREAQPDMKEHRAKLARRQQRTQEREAGRARTVTVALAENAALPADPGLVPAERLEPGLRQQPARKPRSQRKK
ncbi:MAG: protein translocase subunit SecF [Propionibacteriaceae bacterium]|jgi:preprotein translocase subunit SecF|nr:protein translocase subunit SecF [Propionibacteriaceae bacterium]